MAKLGYKVGLLDSDIYGPSIPLMLGISQRPEFDGHKLIPIEKYGVKIMSLGFLIDEQTPVIWRGPLVMRALQQLMSDVDWDELDVMVFDLPPGTGDAQLTLSQSVNLDGAIVVSTPQDVALIDAVKGVEMFRKVNVPILGIIENMSYFICPTCKTKSDIFSSGGARKACKKLGVELIGEIPLDLEIRIGGDEGIPIVLKNPESEHSRIFVTIAKKITENFKS
jgi:ATP-binding protein involved in chromosome partitioning